MRTLACSLLFFSLSSISGWGQTLRVVNAASFLKNAPLTAGSIISIFGPNIANGTAQATDPEHLPTTLGGVTVTIGNTPLALFYTSPRQVNALIGTGISPGTYQLNLASGTGTFTASITISAQAAPGVFSFTGTGTRDGAILNAITFARGPFTVTTNGQPTYLAIYTTGLNLTTAPTVTMGSTAVNVVFYGNAPCCAGLQQINVQLPATLAGAGRVEVSVTSGGNVSNVVEAVILPSRGQGKFPPAGDNQARARELADVAWIPGTHTALVTDEADDVLRVVDLNAKQVTGVIDLPAGSQPGDMAVTSDGKMAVVAERDKGSVALVDLTAGKVTAEVATGGGPSAVDIYNGMAVVANQDVDTVSIVNLATAVVSATIPVDRGPRGVAVDSANGVAYVVAEDAGTIDVINLANNTVTKTMDLGANSRPKSIVLLATLGYGLVVEPAAGPGGAVVAVNLSTGAAQSTNYTVSTGGANAIAVSGDMVYFADQTDASVTAAQATVVNQQLTLTTQSQISVGLGPRSLAIDTMDNLLLVTNEGDGTLALVDLSSMKLAGTINAVKAQGEAQGTDDHNDRGMAANMPTVKSVQPQTIQPGQTVSFTVMGTNFQGATGLAFVDPSTLPGKAGSHGNGNNGSNSNGPFSSSDPNFTVTNVQASSDGTQVTATVTLAAAATQGQRVVRVLTPNGESSYVPASSNTITIQ